MVKVLRDYQESAVQSVFSYTGNPLVVVPTGGGKSLIQAEIAKRSGGRVLCLAHRKELIEQNESAYIDQDGKGCGVYGAGLDRFEYSVSQVLFAQIQSISKMTDRYLNSVFWDYVVIDEAHSITKSGDGMYRKVIDKLLSINPKLKIIGLTATPFRTNDGPIHSYDGAIFDGVSYEVRLGDLISDGYLSTVISRSGAVKGDVDYLKGVKTDYTKLQLDKGFNKDEITDAAINEICEQGKGRACWLLFGVNIDHAEALCKKLQEKGVASGLVHSKMSMGVREKVIDEARRGKIRALVNCDILTTGFDLPSVDLIALIRATKSLGLFIQMVGRGLRLSAGKDNLLLLDYGRNVERHGLLDIMDYGVAEGFGGSGNPMRAKECPDCGMLATITSQECAECGYVFSEGSGGYDDEAYRGEVVVPSEVMVRGFRVGGLRGVSRDEVKVLDGLAHSFYWDGVECKNGHLSPRSVRSKACVACETNRQYKNKANFQGSALDEKIEWRVYKAFLQVRSTISVIDLMKKRFIATDRAKYRAVMGLHSIYSNSKSAGIGQHRISGEVSRDKLYSIGGVGFTDQTINELLIDGVLDFSGSRDKHGPYLIDPKIDDTNFLCDVLSV